MLVRDVDFAANKFAVYSYKGKKRSDRSCVMTPRVREALLGCCAGKNPDDHVFTYDVKKKNDDGTTTIDQRPLKYAPRRSFGTAKREAARWSDGAIDLSKFRGHDMRHTMITRALARGASLAEVAKYAGHTQPTTTWRYNNPDDASGQRIADLMATYHEAEVIPFTVKKQTRKRA
jgi:integrase